MFFCYKQKTILTRKINPSQFCIMQGYNFYPETGLKIELDSQFSAGILNKPANKQCNFKELGTPIYWIFFVEGQPAL